MRSYSGKRRSIYLKSKNQIIKIRLEIARNLIGFFAIRTPKAVLTIGFQDWIVPLPGVHGSSLCIPNFTAKKDKKVLKWTVFGKNARKLCEKGKNPKKFKQKIKRNLPRIGGFERYRRLGKNAYKTTKYLPYGMPSA